MRLLALIISLVLAGPAFAATDPSAALGIAYDQKPGAQLPDLRLTDEAGRDVALRDLQAGRPTLLVPVYYHCPNLCSIVLGDLLSALDAARLRPGQDYSLIAISIDPSETPADAYAAKRRHLADFPTPGAEQNWHFLTAPAVELDRLEQTIGYSIRFDAGLKQFIHPAGLVVLTPDGRVARYLLGVGYRPNDVRLGLLEARAGTIAAASNLILLTCWHFDPATGRYSLAITNLLRLAALLTVATVAGALYLSFRREGRGR